MHTGRKACGGYEMRELCMTLFADYLREDHRRIHKWHQYFPAYEAHFARFRNRHVTLFEIGVAEGGSLEMWRGYFGPFANIVGIDIYPRCKQLEGGQIHIRIGGQSDLDFLSGVVEEFGPPDIVIDDGSHLQHHVNRTFDFLYPLVAKNGVYLVEDLHASYCQLHGGGLGRRGSFIDFAKSYVDKIHADYIQGASIGTPAGDRTTSIHFYDSLAVFEVGEARKMSNGMTGDAARFDGAWAPAGVSRDAFAQFVDHSLRDLEKPGTHLAGVQQDARDTYIKELETELAVLRRSASWRLTQPVQALRRLLAPPRAGRVDVSPHAA
jgi:hypothetical protein